MGNKKMISTKTMVLGAVLTALVIVLQFMGAFIHLGMFSISLVLIPIVIGAATCGVSIGAWLGLVFGLVVLFSGDASAFLMVNAPGTIITVLAKGVLAGLCAGLTYKCLEKYNRTVAVIVAAIVCPLVNTGVFLIGCFVFFFEAIKAWGVAEGYGNVIQYMLLVLVGGNFLFELGTNIVLSPIVVRLINIRKKQI